MGKKLAAVFTLGCRLNTADSSLLHRKLSDSGYLLTDSAATADLVVINSCAITKEAERKSLQMLRKMRKLRPQTDIVFTGCAAELNQEKYLEAGADFVYTNIGKKELAKLGKTEPLLSKNSAANDFFEEADGLFPFRSRAFIKIQEGCDNHCTYCVVPLVRGPERSRDLAEVLHDCRSALDQGFREIVLTGVNTCAYHSNGIGLTGLLAELKSWPGDWRMRLSSTEPHPDNLALIGEMADAGERVCRFLHLSLQHGSDRILKNMNRHYTTLEYAAFARTAKEKIPGLHLGTDIIVGFPGETDEDFAESCAFIRKIGFANIHIFTYSPRPDTPAASMPDQVPVAVAKERYKILQQIAIQAAKEFAETQKGLTLPVIFEEIDENNFARGWSDNYLPVKAPASEVELGKIIFRKLD